MIQRWSFQMMKVQRKHDKLQVEQSTTKVKFSMSFDSTKHDVTIKRTGGFKLRPIQTCSTLAKALNQYANVNINTRAYI